MTIFFPLINSKYYLELYIQGNEINNFIQNYYGIARLLLFKGYFF